MSEDRSEKARMMRALSEDAREAAIDAAPNVVGYERFIDRRKQVELRGAYRKPKSGDGGGA